VRLDVDGRPLQIRSLDVMQFDSRD
jgi:hypothetical protein